MAIETLTYREIADRLGVSLAAAKMRVSRAGWTRTKGNDGRTRVQVPTDDLETAPPARETGHVTGDDGGEAEALREHVADLRQELDAARASLTAADEERARLLDDARQDRERADAERGRLLTTVEGLTASLEAATKAQAEAERHAAAGKAEGQAEAARAKADLERLRRRGLWARILNRE